MGMAAGWWHGGMARRHGKAAWNGIMGFKGGQNPAKEATREARIQPRRRQARRRQGRNPAQEAHTPC